MHFSRRRFVATLPKDRRKVVPQRLATGECDPVSWQAVYEGIKREKPGSNSGSALSGSGSPAIHKVLAGLNSYDKLYLPIHEMAGQRLGGLPLRRSFTWPIADKPNSFPALLKWWADQNPQHRLLSQG